MSIAIKVENLSKAYQIGQFGSGTISRDLERWFVMKLMGKEDPFLKLGETNDRASKGKSDIVWSLKDINLEIEQGDAVGIIGKNGAGKSTLLKLLSRVTSPTSGSIKLKGRVASLLEVGTGFHPELTGRENIYLNGSILGMRKREIDGKIDEIIDFSGIERYIDTPVKRYSSGMYVRLAFAVAAHLENEILVVDEVLAVGDAEFQKKCLGKMGDVSKGEGRTVLFVSHNLGAIKELCQHALVIKNGQEDFYGSVVSGIHHYSQSMLKLTAEDLDNNRSDGWVHLVVIGDTQQDGGISNTEGFEVSAVLKVPDALESAFVHCFVEDMDGQQTMHNYLGIDQLGRNVLSPGTYRVQARVPPIWLKPGVYSLYLKLIGQSTSGRRFRYTSDRVLLDITDKTGMFGGQVHASILPPIDWSIDTVDTQTIIEKADVLLERIL